MKQRPTICSYFTNILLILGLTFLVLPCGEATADPQITIKGDMHFSFNWSSGSALNNKRDNDKFTARQRLRLFITAKVSEELQAFAMMRIIPDRWGDSAPNRVGRGYALDGDGVAMRTRHMFLDWKPNTKMRFLLGIIPTALPFASYRNGVLDTVAGGIAASYKFNDTVQLDAFWARPYDMYANDYLDSNYAHKSLDDEMDMFYLALPMHFSNPDIAITPWLLYSIIGKDSGYWNDRIPAITYGNSATTVDDNGRAWWAGFAGTWILDRFVLKGDFAYGDLRSQKSNFNYNAHGWFASMLAEYKLDWGTPGLFGWYATGADADDVNKEKTWGHMPTISTFGDGFAPTSLGFSGGFGVNEDSLISWTASGRWGMGAQITDISFIDDLKHTIRLAYYRGTNDNNLAGADYQRHLVNSRRDSVLMCKDDYALEVNFNHTYKIYENLTLGVDMGYINMYRGENWGSERDLDDVWAVNTGFEFRF